MALKHFAFAAAVAMSTPAMAAIEHTDTRELGATFISTLSDAFTLSGGNYDFSLAISNLGTSGAQSSITASLYTSVGQYLGQVAAGTGVGINSALSTTKLSLSAGSYKINWFGLSESTNLKSTATLDKITAVPGPEAGVGLSALALGGMGVWLSRRRKEAANAA